MKKILIAASEAVPYAKTGGLADVVGSLPRFFNKKEYDVRVIIPKYACMNVNGLPKLRFVCQFYVDLNWRRQYAAIYQAEYEGVTYYFLDNDLYFSDSTLYGEMHKDVERFAYFSKGVLDSLEYLDWVPDIIHCNDWQTGLIPVYLKTLYGDDEFYHGIKTIFSIHNLKFQGKWRINEVIDITGLPEHIFNYEELESYGAANYLKGGVVYADAVTTVSPSYAIDITTPEGGEGLDGLMRAKSDQLYGILNGLDYKEYNPQTDKHIRFHYNDQTVASEKFKNKQALQKHTSMPKSSDFTIGMVSRLTDQKGFDLVADALDEILSTMNVQIYVLGTGSSKYENMFRNFQNRYPEKMHAYIGYSDEHANRIYASCDAFLMPSLFEPCGLSQMMAMRYGTVPIVRETGGLKDTVKPYNEYERSGTGFTFEPYNAEDMLHVIKYAADVYYYHPEAWLEIQQRAMKEDFSWDASARQYEALYDSLYEE